MHSIHKPSNVDVSKFSFGDIKVNQYGGKACKVKYDGEDFMFQTPRMRCPYGLGAFEEKDGDGNVGAGMVNWVTQTSFDPPLSSAVLLRSWNRPTITSWSVWSQTCNNPIHLTAALTMPFIKMKDLGDNVF